MSAMLNDGSLNPPLGWVEGVVNQRLQQQQQEALPALTQVTSQRDAATAQGAQEVGALRAQLQAMTLGHHHEFEKVKTEFQAEAAAHQRRLTLN